MEGGAKMTGLKMLADIVTEYEAFQLNVITSSFDKPMP
jgi:hypothetical protein